MCNVIPDVEKTVELLVEITIGISGVLNDPGNVHQNVNVVF